MGTVKAAGLSAWRIKSASMLLVPGHRVVGEFDADFTVEGFAGIEAELKDRRREVPSGGGTQLEGSADGGGVGAAEMQAAQVGGESGFHGRMVESDGGAELHHRGIDADEKKGERSDAQRRLWGWPDRSARGTGG